MRMILLYPPPPPKGKKENKATPKKNQFAVFQIPIITMTLQFSSISGEQLRATIFCALILSASLPCSSPDLISPIGVLAQDLPLLLHLLITGTKSVIFHRLRTLSRDMLVG